MTDFLQGSSRIMIPPAGRVKIAFYSYGSDRIGPPVHPTRPGPARPGLTREG